MTKNEQHTPRHIGGNFEDYLHIEELEAALRRVLDDGAFIHSSPHCLKDGPLCASCVAREAARALLAKLGQPA